MREEAGDRESAEHLARQAADHGDTFALANLAAMREEAGDRESAEHLARQAADGDTGALANLAGMRERAGDRESAEHLYRQAADHGDTRGTPLGQTLATRWPNGLDPGGTPTRPWHCSTCHST